MASPAEAEQPVPPELWSWSWSSVSVAGATVAEVRQTASAKGHCRVSATLASKPVWSVDACLATREDFRFVSPDALALVVFKPLPDADDVALGAVYRKGERALGLTSTSLHLPASPRIEGHKLRWLSAREQRETAEGVEVQLLDESVRMIRFDGGAIAGPELPSGPQAKATAADCTPCSYTDADGVYHLVDSAEEIPAQYRGQAGRIRGSIQHADAVPITYRPRSFAQPGEEPVQRLLPAPPASSEPPVFRNELGENFIQYNRRLRRQALYPKTDFNAKCIDNSGERVPCSQTGMQSHR